MRDYGREAHEAAEKHLLAIQDWEDHWESHDDECDCPGGPPAEPDMAGPYDGCETCVIRETLHAAWPILLEAAREELSGSVHGAP